MQHLCCHDDRLLVDYTFAYDITLNAWNVFYRNFYSKITTCYHDSITSIDDIINIVDTLLIFYFRNDLYIASMSVKYILYGFYVVSIAHETVSYEVNIKLYGKEYILFVFLCKCRKSYVFARYIDTLASS